MTHDWKFLSSHMGGGGDQNATVGIVAVVCKRCGTIRGEVIAPRREGNINLGGKCPVAQLTT